LNLAAALPGAFSLEQIDMVREVAAQLALVIFCNLHLRLPPRHTKKSQKGRTRDPFFSSQVSLCIGEKLFSIPRPFTSGHEWM
jgi:hypothetical protein